MSTSLLWNRQNTLDWVLISVCNLFSAGDTSIGFGDVLLSQQKTKPDGSAEGRVWAQKTKQGENPIF